MFITSAGGACPGTVIVFNDTDPADIDERCQKPPVRHALGQGAVLVFLNTAVIVVRCDAGQANGRQLGPGTGRRAILRALTLLNSIPHFLSATPS